MAQKQSDFQVALENRPNKARNNEVRSSSSLFIKQLSLLSFHMCQSFLMCRQKPVTVL